MLRKNKSSRSPLSEEPCEKSQQTTSKLSTSPTIVLEPSPRTAPLPSSSSFMSFHKILGTSAERRSSNDAGSGGDLAMSSTTRSPDHLHVPPSHSHGSTSGSGWKGFSWWGGKNKDKQSERFQAGSSSASSSSSSAAAAAAAADSAQSRARRSSGVGRRSPKMSKDAISGPSNFVHNSRSSQLAHLAEIPAMSPGSPEHFPLSPVSSHSASPNPQVKRRATLSSSEDVSSPTLGRGDVPLVPPIPPSNLCRLGDSPSPAASLAEFSRYPEPATLNQGQSRRMSTDLLDSERLPKSSNTSGLAIAGKKSWSRSVDDFGKLLGMEKKPKPRILLGGFTREANSDTASPTLSSGVPSPILPSSASMLSFPTTTGSRHSPRVVSSSSTPTTTTASPMRSHLPVASVPIAAEHPDPVGPRRKKSKEFGIQLGRSNTRESLNNALGFLTDPLEQGQTKRGPRRKTNSFSGKMLLDVVSGASSMKQKNKDHQDENLPRQSDMHITGGKGPGKASSPPVLLHGPSTTQLDRKNASTSPQNVNSPLAPSVRTFKTSTSEREAGGSGHVRSQSFNLLNNIGLGGKSVKDKHRSGHIDLGAYTDGSSGDRETSMEEGIIRTPSGRAKRTSQIIHKEGFMLKHSSGSSRLGKSGKAASPSLSKSVGDDYFTSKSPLELVKGWKPHKAVLKGTRLHFYKPPSDKRPGIESLFPTTLVDDVSQ